jgi:hypothetical protein
MGRKPGEHRTIEQATAVRDACILKVSKLETFDTSQMEWQEAIAHNDQIQVLNIWIVTMDCEILEVAMFG